MRGSTVVFAVLILPLVVIVPTSVADHLPCAYEAQGTQKRAEILGVGPASAGLYSQPRGQGGRVASADGACAPRDCSAIFSDPRTPEVGTPTIDTPNARALGQTFVPAQHVDRIVLVPASVLPVDVLNPSCVPQEDAGAYVRVSGIVNVALGTDRVPLVTAPFLP